MDYIALGHVHKHTEIGVIDSTHFAYCGCPEGQGFDELDQKGIYIGEVGKNFCELEFTPVSRRLHIEEKVDISGLNTTAEICDAILNQLKTAYGESFGGNLLYFVKVKNHTEFSLDLESLSAEPTLKGIFVKKMLEKQVSADETMKPLIRKALNLGIKAFKTEVKYDED